MHCILTYRVFWRRTTNREQLFVVIHAWNLNCLATAMLLWNIKQVTIVIKNYWNTVVTVHSNVSLLDAQFHNWQIFGLMNIPTKAIKDQEDTIQIKIEGKFILASLTRITGLIMLTNEWKWRSLLGGLYQFTLHRKCFTKVICRKWHAGSKCSLVLLLIFDHLKCEKQWSNKGVFFFFRSAWANKKMVEGANWKRVNAVSFFAYVPKKPKLETHWTMYKWIIIAFCVAFEMCLILLKFFTL